MDDIWNLFKTFNSTQLAAMAPEHEVPKIGWYSRFARHPFYGVTGVNSGVMLMNLTRIRSTMFKVRSKHNHIPSNSAQWKAKVSRVVCILNPEVFPLRVQSQRLSALSRLWLKHFDYNASITHAGSMLSEPNLVALRLLNYQKIANKTLNVNMLFLWCCFENPKRRVALLSIGVLINVAVGISEQYDPHWPFMGRSSAPTLPEVQEPHNLGRPGPPQYHIPLQPRYNSHHHFTYNEEKKNKATWIIWHDVNA